MHWTVGVQTNIKYTSPILEESFPAESPCLAIGDYRNGTVGYAVCNVDPSVSYIEQLVRDTITNNITSFSVGYYKPSDIEKSLPRFQCMRFLIQILDQERHVRISNLTASSCPELSIASLLYPRLNLSWARIDGLSLQQDPINVTLACPMSSNLEALILQNNGLASAPFSSCPIYFSNLIHVLFENQQLKLDDIPLFTLSDHLKYLSLHNCSLHNIPRSTFVGLINLRMLNISSNKIRSFEKEVFHYLSSLTVLRIDNNMLTTLDMGIFQELISLQYLYLSGNHFSSIDGKVAILPSLRVIVLSQNNLTVVRKTLFRDSPMLTVIELTNNNISNIEYEAFANMTSFKALDASNNLLTHINPCNWFDDVTKINFIVLASNNITSVEGLQCLSKMRVFNLFGNVLSTIPPLKNLINLDILDLGCNAIHYVMGEEIIPAIRLRYLYIDSNEMMRLGVFSNSSSIEILDLKLNKLTFIPEFCFNGLQSLNKLNLSYNNLRYLGAFAFPANLQKLGLYGNELSDLGSINKNLPHLHKLEIGHNNLSTIDIYLPSVVYLDISQNPLEDFSLQLCERMPNLQEIFLEKLGIREYYRDLFGTFGCIHWRHVSLARNRIAKLDYYSKLQVSGSIDYSYNPLKSIPMYPQLGFYPSHLYFNNCSIDSIAPMSFQHMYSLVSVELKGNHIQHFPQMSPSHTKYDLRDNPIVCSCHLRWLLGNILRRNYLFTNCMDPVTSSVEVFDLLSSDRLVCQHELNCAQGCVCYGLNTSTINIVKCSSKSLTTIPLRLPTEADVIYLDHNQFSNLHFPSDMEKMAASQLFLQHSQINFLEKELFTAFPYLNLIDLSYNALTALNMDVFYSLYDIKKLFLHGNCIHQIYSAAGFNLPNLQIMTLHGNDLDAVTENLDIAIRSMPLANLTLAGNPWQCAACAGPILRKWLAQHADIVSDAAGFRCNKSQVPVLDINTTTLEYAKCVKAIHTLTSTHWGVIAGLIVSLIILLISSALTYCFKDHILVLLYNKCDFLKRRRRELNVLYDVRIIYDETDERVRQWVVSELLQVLETEWRLDVFLVERDMLAGGNHADEIAQSIRQSRRTLTVVSRNFIDNEWAQFAYQVAFQFQIENDLHQMLVAAWEPVEIDSMEHSIKVYFKTKQVMYRTSRRFWPLLKSKLPVSRENLGQIPDNIELNLLHR